MQPVAHPSRYAEDMMGIGQSGVDEFQRQAAADEHIKEPIAVDMSQLAIADRKSSAAETMLLELEMAGFEDSRCEGLDRAQAFGMSQGTPTQ